MEDKISDPTGLKVSRQLVGLTDAAGNIINPATGSGGGGGGTTTYTLSAPATVAVAATDTALIPANANRKFLLIQVNGAADVALSFGAGAATLAAGVMLAASDSGAGYPGGSISLNHLGAVRGIGRGASSITWSEGV